MTQNQNRGVRRGQLGHSFNLPYSLELFLDFWKKSFFYQNLDWILMDWPSGGASPLRTTVCRLPGRGLFFPQITGPWNFRPHFGDFRIFWIQKRRGFSPEAGYTNFQPVMFDMDPFGGKKVPCTKMPQKLKKLNSPIWGLLRPPGVLNSPSPFLSLHHCDVVE